MLYELNQSELFDIEGGSVGNVLIGVGAVIGVFACPPVGIAIAIIGFVDSMGW